MEANADAAGDSEKPPFVVGIGASAGGLEALERLFRRLPTTTGMAFVIVQHLSPDFDSVMGELLIRQTDMPVCTVEDGIAVQPNAVYLIPPKKEMIITGGKLLLTDKDPKQALSLPIDTFFRSLAQECGPQSIGVILSGTGSDGSRGVRSIHQAGGLVLVQDEQSAKFDGMPKSAVATGCVDHVLSPEQIAQALTQYASHPDAGILTADDTGQINGDSMQRLMRLLRESYLIDFSLYKPTTVRRRIERRLLLKESLDFDQYVSQLASDPQELNSLYHDLLIGVTQFFRDQEAFHILETQVLPELIDRLAPDETLRIWVAGCATGEEAYSMAILADECLAAVGRRGNAKIFATDVHQSSIDFASAGIYPESVLANVSEERRRNYFTRRATSYQVNQELRQLVVFARHNLIKDAPFTRLDLISCRNLLIYLQPVVQKKVISLFHFGLKTGGALFLGPSESVADLADEFKALDHHWKIYRKLRDVRLTREVRLPLVDGATQIPLLLPSSRRSSGDQHLEGVYRDIMDRFMPPAILINEHRDIIHVFGSAADFLRIKSGPKSNDILDLFDPELRTAVSVAIQRAAREWTTVVYNAVTYKKDEHQYLLRLSVVPLPARNAEPRHMLITLEPIHTPAPPPPAETSAADDPQNVSRDRIQHLEAELRHNKENLQTTIEELEASNEELHATNEELVASNEELQSTNEELHSVNEELYTVNAEYQRKITELTELTEDMANLLATTDVGVLFLDRELCIRKFTPRIARSFNIVESDIGRSFDHFTHNIQDEDVMAHVRWVLSSGQPYEKEVRDRAGQWHFLRILPYQSKADLIGIVLTLIDIQSIKQAEANLHEQQRQLQGVLDNSPAFVFVKDLEGHYLLANRQARRVLGKKAEQVVGKTDYDFLPRPVADRLTAHDRTVAYSGKPLQIEEIIPAKGKGRTYLANLYPLRDEQERVTATAGILTDITRQKIAQRRAREAVKQRDQFLAMLSHELRNPLSAISSATELMKTVDVPNANLQQICDVIRRQSQHTARLLDDLLDISRAAQGKIELRKEVLDLRASAAAAVESVRPLMMRYEHELTLDVPATPIWVEGDAARLQQIQVNLLVNAAKYTPNKGKIQLRLFTENEKAFLVVADTGVGMTADFQKRIFEPFVQSKRSLDRRDGGIGLGLTLARTLTELHQGEVEVHSDGPGKGSVFTVWLPVTTKRPKAATLDSAEPPPTDRKLRVLIIEDNADLRRMMQMLMSLHGFEVETAAEGLSGLTIFDSIRPDVALIDIGLPELNGYEVARRIRARSESVYLIALTGYGQDEDRRKALDAGFNEHLTKPVNFSHLRSILARVAESTPR